jgi:hypothetical protein
MLRDPYGLIQKRCRAHGADLFQTPGTGEFGEDDFLAHELQYSDEHWSWTQRQNRNSPLTMDLGPGCRLAS